VGDLSPVDPGRLPEHGPVPGPVSARQIHQIGLEDVGADAEIDIIQAGTDLAEFYQLSQAALALAKVQAGALSLEQATAITGRPGEDDFLACGFVHIGVWGRRPPAE
jgi:hypothetical protein